MTAFQCSSTRATRSAWAGQSFCWNLFVRSQLRSFLMFHFFASHSRLAFSAFGGEGAFFVDMGADVAAARAAADAAAVTPLERSSVLLAAMAW